MVALVLTAMDPTTSSDLKRALMVAVDRLCHASAESSDSGPSVLASRLLALAENYEPINKAGLVYILAHGSGATMSIARYVSYCLILQRSSSAIAPVRLRVLLTLLFTERYPRLLTATLPLSSHSLTSCASQRKMQRRRPRPSSPSLRARTTPLSSITYISLVWQ